MVENKIIDVWDQQRKLINELESLEQEAGITRKMEIIRLGYLSEIIIPKIRDIVFSIENVHVRERIIQIYIELINLEIKEKSYFVSSIHEKIRKIDHRNYDWIFVIVLVSVGLLYLSSSIFNGKFDGAIIVSSLLLTIRALAISIRNSNHRRGALVGELEEAKKSLDLKCTALPVFLEADIAQSSPNAE